MASEKQAAANAGEVAERLAGLPEFSRAVYADIQANLYAESGFSDVTASDVADRLGRAPLAVNAAIGHLMAAGLVFSEDHSGITFLHTYEHDEFDEA